MQCTLPRAPPVVDRAIGQTSLCEVMSQDLGFGIDGFGEFCFENATDSCVQLLSLAAQQRAVRGVPDKRMLESVVRVWRYTATKGQPGRDEGIDAAGELRLRHPCNGDKQCVREFATDHRADLCDLLRRRKPVEPGDQRGLQRSRNFQRCRGADPTSRAPSSTALVSSSMNSGTPSVCVTIRWSSVGGNARSTTIRSANCAACLCVSRRRVTRLARARPTHGGWNSGRNETTNRTGRSASNAIALVQQTQGNWHRPNEHLRTA